MLKKEGHPERCIIRQCKGPFTLHMSPYRLGCNFGHNYKSTLCERSPSLSIRMLETVFSSSQTMPDHKSAIWQGAVYKPFMSTLWTGHQDAQIYPRVRDLYPFPAAILPELERWLGFDLSTKILLTIIHYPSQRLSKLRQIKLETVRGPSNQQATVSANQNISTS